MTLINSLNDFCVLDAESISTSLAKLERNESKLLFVLNEGGYLLGSVTDGDVRRWLQNSTEFDLNGPISQVMNKNVKWAGEDTPREIIELDFINGVNCIPILDNIGRLMKICFKDGQKINIGNKFISKESPAFIIAEIGNNHQGSITLAKELVDHAVEAGVDCVKFQMRQMSKLYRHNTGAVEDLGAEYTMDLLNKYQLPNDSLFEIFDYCSSKEVIALCTPWDNESVDLLEQYGLPAYKVASADMTNFELLERLAATKKPLICSTGMSTEIEILQTVKFLERNHADFVLLHCNSTYPTPYKDVNLRYLPRLSKVSGKLIGYSGHERGIHVPIAAVALGAKVIEKHLTIDTKLEGADHKVSLLPHELSSMVTQIRQVEDAFGSSYAGRVLTQGELINRDSLAKSLVAKKPLFKGDIVTRDVIEVRGPGQGLQPNRIDDLVGIKLNRDVSAQGFFFESDLRPLIQKRTKYNFDRPYGIPVRYHDFASLSDGVHLDFVEFHLSYKDLELDPTAYLPSSNAMGLAVHCPELFANDHLLNLASEDQSYRARSISELQRTIVTTKRLNAYFSNESDPVLIVNAGGWSQGGFKSKEDRPRMYDRVAETLSTVDLTGVQIAIQTMPPFPWHFGGQSFHNLFIDPDEIVRFCNANPEIKICLDISHSMMACNHFGWSLESFVQKVAPFTCHLHIVDALGIDGEGVEIGKGDVDFQALSSVLKNKLQGVQFIPEVWQGHVANGEGFWKALTFLEEALE